MPTNLYGPGDNYDLNNSHVIPALLRKFHEAAQSNSPTVTVWGSGTPRREFLYVDDLAGACLFLLEQTRDQWRALNTTHVNIGCGEDVTIRELVELVCGVTGYRGDVQWDASKPDGTPRKLMDVSLMRKLGWIPTIGLRDGLQQAYRWFQDNYASSRLSSNAA